jgi:hypothetical protein
MVNEQTTAGHFSLTEKTNVHTGENYQEAISKRVLYFFLGLIALLQRKAVTSQKIK